MTTPEPKTIREYIAARLVMLKDSRSVIMDRSKSAAMFDGCISELEELEHWLDAHEPKHSNTHTCLSCDGYGVNEDGEMCEACKGRGVMPGASPVIQPQSVGAETSDSERIDWLLKNSHICFETMDASIYPSCRKSIDDAMLAERGRKV